MKVFKLIILLLLLAAAAQAQPRGRRVEIPEPVKVIALYTTSIALEAVGDALYDDGDKAWGKSLQAASLGLVIVSPFVLDVERGTWYWYLSSYVCLRVALFDPMYNATRGLPLGYTGTTSVWDKAVQRVVPPEGVKMFGHSVFFIIGVSIPICEL